VAMVVVVAVAVVVAAAAIQFTLSRMCYVRG
jgi:hypothetical protein